MRGIQTQKIANMKTPRSLLLAVIAGGMLAAPMSALPPSKSLPVPPGSAARQSPTTTAEQPMRMTVPNPGSKLKTTVVCTPERAATDPRCRAHCGK